MRSYLRRGTRKDGKTPVTPTYGAILDDAARGKVTEAFSDFILILQRGSPGLREHLLGQIEQFERLGPFATLPVDRREKPLTRFGGEEE